MFLHCQYEKIKKFISNAKSEGATILTGGVRPAVRLGAFGFAGIHILLRDRTNFFLMFLTAS